MHCICAKYTQHLKLSKCQSNSVIDFVISHDHQQFRKLDTFLRLFNTLYAPCSNMSVKVCAEFWTR